MQKKELGLQTFKNILQMTQEGLHFYLLGQIESMYNSRDIYRVDGSFIYAKGDIPVLMLAHLDTVHTVAPTEETIFHDKEKNVLWCPDGIGGDDRCGVFSILDMLTQGYRPHVLFCWDEEIGTIGSSFFTKNVENYFGEDVQTALTEINFAIQLDRKGFGESVYYYLDNIDFEEYINSFGFKTHNGSYTDICQVCPEFGFAGVNLSAGYMDEHTSYERIYINEMYKTQRKVKEILEDQYQNPKFYEYKEDSYAGYGNYGYSNYYQNGSYCYWGDEDVYDESDYLNYDDDETSFIPYKSRNKKKEVEQCEFCFLDKGTVPWSDTDNEVLSHLCDECREKYLEDVSQKERYTEAINNDRK